MKNLIAIIALIAALLLVNNAYSQAPLKPKDDINNINLRMDQYSNQYSIGNGFITTGIITAIVGTMVSMNNLDKPMGGMILSGIGGVLTISGSIINATAHRRLRSSQYHQRF